jgi:hypothetical protein
MSDTIINLITSPDKLFNSNPSLLLVNPGDSVKEDFNKNASKLLDPINLYLFEGNPLDIRWLLDVIQSVDYIILDIDNTKDSIWLIGYLLSFGKTFYLTNEVQSVYNIINVNRIYELKQFMEGVNYFGISQQQ